MPDIYLTYTDSQNYYYNIHDNSGGVSGHYNQYFYHSRSSVVVVTPVRISDNKLGEPLTLPLGDNTRVKKYRFNISLVQDSPSIIIRATQGSVVQEYAYNILYDNDPTHKNFTVTVATENITTVNPTVVLTNAKSITLTAMDN